MLPRRSVFYRNILKSQSKFCCAGPKETLIPLRNTAAVLSKISLAHSVICGLYGRPLTAAGLLKGGRSLSRKRGLRPPDSAAGILLQFLQTGEIQGVVIFSRRAYSRRLNAKRPPFFSSPRNLLRVLHIAASPAGRRFCGSRRGLGFPKHAQK